VRQTKPALSRQVHELADLERARFRMLFYTRRQSDRGVIVTHGGMAHDTPPLLVVVKSRQEVPYFADTLYV
jgi:hypothetical protein